MITRNVNIKESGGITNKEKERLLEVLPHNISNVLKVSNTFM